MANYEILKDKCYYNELKKKINSLYGNIWKRISGRPFVGNCSYLYKKLKPDSYQDFYNKYINYTSPNKTKSLMKDEYYGRTIDDLLNLANEYKYLCNDNSLTIDEFFDDIVNHVIIETFDGHIAESYITNILEKKGFTVINSDGRLDAVLGVDLIVKWKEKIISFLQIKPITTFLGDKNKSLIDDRINFYGKQEKLNEYIKTAYKNCIIKNANIEYMLYDKSTYDNENKLKWYYKNNRSRFSLNELCDKKGKSIVNLSDFELKNLIIH